MTATGPKCWRDNPELLDALEDAGWRYATLIGIVDPEEEDVPASVRASDREKYGHMIRKADNGGPLWVCREATTFVCELTGAARETATAWLNNEWHAPAGEV